MLNGKGWEEPGERVVGRGVSKGLRLHTGLGGKYIRVYTGTYVGHMGIRECLVYKEI